MKKITKRVTVGVLLFTLFIGIMYLIISFGQLNINFKLWSVGSRTEFSVISIIALIVDTIGIMATYNVKDL